MTGFDQDSIYLDLLQVGFLPARVGAEEMEHFLCVVERNEG